MNNTHIPKKEQINKKWYLINAKNQNLGHLSTKIALILKGKNNIEYTPHINHMNYIIVINAKHVTITGNKKYTKTYKKHSGKPGSLKITTFNKIRNRMPIKIVENSIKGMLSKNTLGRQLFSQLKVYPESEHPHEAQKPENIIL